MYRQPETTEAGETSNSAASVHGLECMHCTVRGNTICAALSEQEMATLDQSTHHLRCTAGTTLVRTGDPRQFVYTLTSGALRMVRTLADGRRQITGFVLPGDYIGLTGTPTHRHDIEAIIDSRLCRTPAADMLRIRVQYPHLERKLLQRTGIELAASQDIGMALARLQPSERLAHFLLRLAARSTRPGTPGDVVPLPMGRGDIADHLGLTMETVSRTFTKLKQQRLIALPQLHLVQILDYAGLRRLAGEDIR